jgi:Fe-S-cluster-containing dehydrogenase component
MNIPVILTDPDRCIHCEACEIHCTQMHGLPLDQALGCNVNVGPVFEDGKVLMRGMFLQCQQCNDPPCLGACPTGAMIRGQGGVILVQQGRCTGCGACALACPWRMPRINPRTGRMMKCDLCLDRLKAGEEPACVLGCPTHALRVASPASASAERRMQYARRIRTRR